MDWALSDGTIFARDRETQPYFLGRKTHAFKHAMARAPSDRHYGLGDKTGPLDLTGRRLRCAMRDSLGFDPERGDPLYKNWPFLIVRDAASGVSHGVFYDNGAEGSSISAASVTITSAAIASMRPRTATSIST
jgi:alpha-glucosidase